MKKVLLLLTLLVSANLVFAQFTATGTHLYTANSGNVGIGNGTLFVPQYKLHVYDGTGSGLSGIGLLPGSAASDNTTLLGMKTSNGTNGFVIKTENSDALHGQSAIFINYGNGAGLGKISLMSNAIDLRTGVGYTDNITSGSFGTSALYISNTQQVGIGTTSPGTNKLAVEGTIGARAVKVTLQNPWPDYVFKTGYTLPSLKALEEYIRINSHLPGIPSAKEIEKTGIDLGATQARLLEKIEELTLYTIELEKRVASLQSEQDRFNDLQRQLDEVKKQLQR